MMVTFVSQCEKHALKRTRRVLDAFANRIGDNTWQTLITEEGLLTVKKMLKQSASRSTAVSCHWIRSRSRSQLLWIVGNRNKFNSQGYVPVNRTEKSFLGREDENDWKYLSLISTFAKLAALFHDWGKASRLFQDKLNPAIKTTFKGDPVRHEWVSTILFSLLVKNQGGESDEQWLETLIKNEWDELQLQQGATENYLLQSPLANLPDAAALLAWLILSHHRLPFLNEQELKNWQDIALNTHNQLITEIRQNWGYENNDDISQFQRRIKMCFEFPNGLLSHSTVWIRTVQKVANELKNQLPLFRQAMTDGSWRVIAHHARLCLMLGDHNYSSKGNDPQWRSEIALYANTHKINHIPQFKQKLDEHLVKVAEIAGDIAEMLPYFESEPSPVSDIPQLAYDKNSKGKFSWQEDAVNSIYQYRKKRDDEIKGYFIVNMASTGCGKTRANVKIMQALSEDKQSFRFILSLGLRTLALQTGDEYKDKNSIGLNEGDIAVLIGSKAVAQLHQQAKENDDNLKAHDQDSSPQLNTNSNNLLPYQTGSESQEMLFDENEEELRWAEDKWQGVLPEELLSTVLTRAKDRALLYAPVLACTIDHIMGATETVRGGRYILPCLRLMSSDLVIDEVDDFTDSDSIAVARLIYMAGLLGRKVMISSATITPDTALAYFHAYQSGWYAYAKSRQQPLEVGCLWVDEGEYDSIKDKCQSSTLAATLVANDDNTPYLYQQYHDKFIKRRVNVLAQQPARRKALIVPTPKDNTQDSQQCYFNHILNAALAQHDQHAFLDKRTGIQVSFGVIRVANILPCVDLTRFLLECACPEGVEIRTMAYHSQQVLLLRHEQEQHLDSVLKRKEQVGEEANALNNPIIRQHLENVSIEGKSQHLLFILVATPVEEVGRDHDFDWAVVEPSSYRSVIQMAGRVRRHREGEVQQPNIALLQYNKKGFEGGIDNPFSRPGYENNHIGLGLSTHNLCDLVDEQQLLKSVDATPRIQQQTNYENKKHGDLACLEHAAIKYTLKTEYIFPPKQVEKPVATKRRSQSKNYHTLPRNAASHIWGYTHGCWWMTAVSQQLASFRSQMPSFRLVLEISPKGTIQFSEYTRESGWISVGPQNGIYYNKFPESIKKRLWLVRDYEQSIQSQGMDGKQATSLSRFYGELTFLKQQNRDVIYHYDDQMGIYPVIR
ncbi:type I-F CRISPR-associated helicase Cas3f [Providencia vermicola]|uniref:type I-F CRISPR-associated helicase Cas3f n=1 Tax=Providencia vermicola TaxID=333965 RepID=UPI0034DCE931